MNKSSWKNEITEWSGLNSTEKPLIFNDQIYSILDMENGSNAFSVFEDICFFLELSKNHDRFFCLIQYPNNVTKEILINLIKEKFSTFEYSRKEMYKVWNLWLNKVDVNMYDDLNWVGLSLITDLLRDKDKKIEFDVLRYLNLHRDILLKRNIKVLLLLSKDDMENFIEIAWDLWDFRTKAFFIE